MLTSFWKKTRTCATVTDVTLGKTCQIQYLFSVNSCDTMINNSVNAMLDICRPWGKKQHYYYSGVLQSGWLETKDSALTLTNLRLRYRRNFLIFHLSKTTKSDIWCLLLLPATSGYFSPLWNCHTVNFGRKLALPEERNNKKKPVWALCVKETFLCPLVNQVVHCRFPLVKLKRGKSK